MILILGGTSESKEIVQMCNRYDYPVVYTTTTEVINDLPENTKRWVGKLDISSFLAIIKECNISLIVDATHPFAVEISKLAMSVSSMTGVPYIRFERTSIGEPEFSEKVNYVNSIQEAATLCEEMPGIIFSTIGVNKLTELINHIGDRRSELVVRILPVISSIKICEQLNIHTSKIVAMQGPFTFEIDSALIQRFDAKVMISKDSGDRGGLDVKFRACSENGCSLIIIKRPEIEYTNVCRSISECIEQINTYNLNNGSRNERLKNID